MSPSKRLFGELISEFIAVVIIIAFGDSVAAMYVLYDPSPTPMPIGVSPSSGARRDHCHLCNRRRQWHTCQPAVTISLALFRGFSWRKVHLYCLAQIAGRFVGAALVYLNFAPVIDHYNAVHHFSRYLDGGASGVFFTHPGLAVTPLHSLIVSDCPDRASSPRDFRGDLPLQHRGPTGEFGALIICLIVATIGASSGYLDAWAINPARDFGPRLFAWCAVGAPPPSRHPEIIGGADYRPITAITGRHYRGGDLPISRAPLSCRASIRRKHRPSPARTIPTSRSDEA